MDSAVGEAHANRGAALVAMKRWADSIPAISKGIELQAAEMEKSYYNRAIAYEELGNVRGAYFDYMKAMELKPDWEAPKMQLTRFTVRR
jgi:tetratricopeptide (TPR) repeat protein